MNINIIIFICVYPWFPLSPFLFPLSGLKVLVTSIFFGNLRKRPGHLGIRIFFLKRDAVVSARYKIGVKRYSSQKRNGGIFKRSPTYDGIVFAGPASLIS